MGPELFVTLPRKQLRRDAIATTPLQPTTPSGAEALVDASSMLRTLELEDLGGQIDTGTPAPIGIAALWSALTPSEQAQITQVAARRVLAAGEILFTEGQPTRSLFIIRNGSLELRRGGSGRLAELGPGDWTGIFGLLAGRRRAAEARALSPIELFEIPAVAALRLITEKPTFRAAIKRHFNQRLAAVFCGSTPLLDCAGAVRQDLARSFSPAEYAAGRHAVLVEASGLTLALVAHGELRIIGPSLAEPLTLARGQFFGLTGASVSLQAQSRVNLLLFSSSSRRGGSQELLPVPERARRQGLFVDRHLFVGDMGIAGLA